MPKTSAMTTLITPAKATFAALGGGVGWLVGEFKPAFPLIIVAIVFIFCDAWAAYQLDRRVHKAYPDKTKREKAYFTSFAFGKVIRTTIPRRLLVILLAFLVEKYVILSVHAPLSYIATGAICFEQAWSVFENWSSCQDDKESRLWRMLQRIMVDKTSRHFDVEMDEFRTDGRVTDEQIANARKRLLEMEELKKQQDKTEDTL